jgi:hypothetical protein
MQTLDQLMTAAGAAETALSMHELEHGYQPKPGPVMDEHNRLLLANADAKAALRCHMASVTGVYRHELFVRPSKEPISPEPNNTNTTTKTNMAKLNEAFPSKYLTADDFTDGDMSATIISANIESIGQGTDKSQKILIKLKGIEKGFVCNKTNANTIAKVTGSDDTDDWIGKRITIGAREVQFKDEMIMAIRVSLKKPDATKPATPAHTVNEDADNF